MKYIKILIISIALFMSSGCSDYLDIVPDNVPTLDYAFRMRSTAERYLFTCYSFLPDLGSYNAGNPAAFGAGEFWFNAETYQYFTGWNIARGLQNVNNPILDYWGGNVKGDYWTAISQCNVFLENINTVPDLDKWEMNRWISEVKFLKAYYHYLLAIAYGPIPILDENLPISSTGEQVRVFREPMDDVYDYIINLIDDAIIDLPEKVIDENSEMGRITKVIAMGVKAKIMVYAASPLFNGNIDYQNFLNKDGTQLFNTTYSEEKWKRASIACSEAIEAAHSIGHQLFEFIPTLVTGSISPETQLHLNCRGTITERWNNEIIWANTSSRTSYMQEWSQPRALSESQRGYTASNGSYGATLNIAKVFYSENGVPIKEDITWDYGKRFDLRQATENDKYRIKVGYITAGLNFDREPRFYGSLGFDGGIWYGNGNYNDNAPYWLEGKFTQFLGKEQGGWHAVPGYWPKKLVNHTNTAINSNTYVTVNYPWVMLRLGDLYLLYAETLNEMGELNKAIEYVDHIRAKYNLPGVVEAWSTYSNNPSKYTTKSGLREIIQQEREIEFALEGERFWDLRRWKTAPERLNVPITGWDVEQKEATAYYREKILFNMSFSLKDYFWPISQHDLLVNTNLVQNPGWGN